MSQLKGLNKWLLMFNLLLLDNHQFSDGIDLIDIFFYLPSNMSVVSQGVSDKLEGRFTFHS